MQKPLNNMAHVTLSVFSLILLSTIFNLALCDDFPDLCHPKDKAILLRIKSHFGNPASLASWDTATDCCTSWNEVRCNIDGHVNMLSITEGDDIKGPLPPFLDELPFIWSLNIYRLPHLTGPIPSSITKLKSLTALIISETNVGGSIPEFLVQLNLTQLLISSNKFTGRIPDFLGKMKNLQDLDLSSNMLTGSVPPSLGQLSGLGYLRLDSNKLSGALPGFLAGLKSLHTIDLSSNSFTGRIPESYGSLPHLTTLALSGNKLTGSIPKSLVRNQIGSFELARNKFTGDASFLFDKQNTAVLSIDISDNSFKFDFSKVNLGRNLYGFNISHNMIYGSLPLGFGLMRHIDALDVSYNQLCGPIPNGRRFKRVDPVIFAHNKCLCGGPFPGCK